MAATTNTIVWKIIIAIFVALSVLFGLFFYFSGIFVTIIVGFALIFIAEKLMKEYQKSIAKYQFKLWLRKLVGFGLVLFWLIVALLLVGQSVGQLASAVEQFAEGESVTGLLFSKVKDKIPGYIQQHVSHEEFRKFEQGVIGFFSGVISQLSFFVANGVLIIPLLFYLYFSRWNRLKKDIYAAVPKEWQGGFLRATSEISRQLHDFFAAKVIESTIIGAICCLGFYVAGLKGWLILGLLAGFLNIVPFIGPIIGAIPPLLFAALDAPIVAAIVVVTILIAQLVDNLYLIPFMISSKVKIDSLLSIILILVGAQLLGPMGMVFAVPVYLIYKIVLRESYRELVKIYG
jgi:predicted PurR-regulated permease PerM